MNRKKDPTFAAPVSAYREDVFVPSDALLVAVMREYDAFFWREGEHLAVRRCYGEGAPYELHRFILKWKHRLLQIADHH